jgi:prephenate dehydrogenase
VPETTDSGPALPGRIGIVGLGLIGGSLARALRALQPAPEILASSLDPRELEQAVADGSAQRPGTPDQVAAGADLLVYATPPQATALYLEEHGSRWRAGAVVTDVASVKRALVARARALGLGARFVGSHPMAGDERAGYAASRADLFVGARVWITPLDGESASVTAIVEALWQAVGASTMVIDAEQHDRLVAWTSHLPQISETALASALAHSGFLPEALGPGGRDATRLAVSPAGLWQEILLANADLLEQPLARLEAAAHELAEAVRARDGATIRRIFETAARWRGA